MSEIGLTLVLFQFLHFLFAVLFTFRLAFMLVFEEGMFGVASRIRVLAGVRIEKVSVPNQLGQMVEIDQATSSNWIGKGLTCFNCTSIWVAMLAALFLRYPLGEPTDYFKLAGWFFMYTFSISGAAVILRSQGR